LPDRQEGTVYNAGTTREEVSGVMRPSAPAIVLAGFLLQQGPPGTAPSAPAQTPPPASSPGPESKSDASRPATPPVEEEPIVTHHELRAGGRTLRYTATTGYLPIRNATSGDIEARIFFIAYTLDGVSDAARRPLMISFNGGPGSSSVWLHLGALGPKRVRMNDDGTMPAAPYVLVDNESTWLDQTDLVFVDPVGTGYSRPAKPDLGQRFWGVEGDIQSVGEFIRLYLTRYQRWTSPLFMVGESYGTTRAAGLAGHLIERGIAFNGVLLVSSILNFQTADFAVGNDLPYVLYLPTYTATAWYHKRLAPELQRDLETTLREVENWSTGEYATALSKGAALPVPERTSIAEKLARYTGLDRRVVEQNDLRIEINRFCKDLLRDTGRTVGRLDSRFVGMDRNNAGERPAFDPSLAAIRPPYTATFNDYVRRELGFKSDLPYYILGGGIGKWDWDAENRFADTSDALGGAFARNPHMRLFVASGYFDLATPYFATEYTLDHLGLDASLRSRVTQRYYEAGHMMYIDVKSLAALRRDVAAFLGDASVGR
jgi:carboxypeptidase C (cathepsin A)